MASRAAKARTAPIERGGDRSDSRSAVPEVVPEILNLPQAASYLGVSTKTFQRVLRETDVPGRKVGREWKFSRSALTAWVGAGRSRDFLDGSDDDGATTPAVTREVRRRRRREDLWAEED